MTPPPTFTLDMLTAAIAHALGNRAHVLWATTQNGAGKVRVDTQALAAHATTSAMLAARVHIAANKARVAQGHAPFDIFTVEFVDHLGTVTGAHHFAEQHVKATTPAQPVPQGHTPIPGLRPSPQQQTRALPGVKHIIAVGAGKGGVGKSTVALNLAVGLARRGHAAGLLDGDIYGPSMPTMLGWQSMEPVVHQGMLEPFYVHGVKCMTIGKLVDADKPLIWRGPMAHGAFKQLTEQTSWGDLDYLIIDLPPGTGDVSLTMAQLLQIAGAVIVCTPQKVAQDDAVRAARMFQQLNIPVLGVVENMSYFIGDDGKTYDIFGRGGAQTMAQRLGVPFLGAIPITMALRENCDNGNPTANFTGAHAAGTALRDALEQLVTNVEGQVALAALRSGNATPTLRVT